MNTSDAVGDLRKRREAADLSQLAVALRADCSPAMVGLVDRGYRPHRSAVIERIDRALSDAERAELAPLTAMPAATLKNDRGR